MRDFRIFADCAASTISDSRRIVAGRVKWPARLSRSKVPISAKGTEESEARRRGRGKKWSPTRFEWTKSEFLSDGGYLCCITFHVLFIETTAIGVGGRTLCRVSSCPWRWSRHPAILIFNLHRSPSTDLSRDTP